MGNSNCCRYGRNSFGSKMNFLKDILSYGSTASSARVINIVGAITASALLLWDTIVNSVIRSEAFGMYLAYCAGVYGYGNKLDKESKDDKSNSDTINGGNS